MTNQAATALAQVSNGIADLVEMAARRAVAVHGRTRMNASGILWEPGVVVTAEETLERDEDIRLTLPDGRRAEAKLVGRDPSTDVAVLRFEAEPGDLAAPVPAPALRAGHLAVAVGRADEAAVAALGMVSAAGPAWRSSQGGLIDALLRFDIDLPARSEGGLLSAADGTLVGMAVFGPRRRVLAIPTRTLQRVAHQILDKGHVGRGYLGLGLQPVALQGEGEKGRHGVMIVNIDADGPAKAAGLLQGDILLAIDDERVEGVRGVFARLGPDSVGRALTIDFVRGGQPHRTQVTVAERRRD